MTIKEIDKLLDIASHDAWVIKGLARTIDIAITEGSSICEDAFVAALYLLCNMLEDLEKNIETANLAVGHVADNEEKNIKKGDKAA